MAIDLSKQVGPLPLGAWFVVVGGGLGIAWYTKRSGSTAPTDENPVDVTGNPGVGDGSVGGWVSNTPSPVGGTVGNAAPITTNEEWGQQAINYLLASNYDATLADSAIRKYLSGVGLSISENVLVGMALIKLGSPPSPLPVSENSGTPPVRTPIPSGTPPPSPGPSAGVPVKQSPPTSAKPAPSSVSYKGWVTVKSGDSLWKMAQKYYGNGALWGKIYAVNRKGVTRPGGTQGMIVYPNLIQPGWYLLIPN